MSLPRRAWASCALRPAVRIESLAPVRQHARRCSMDTLDDSDRTSSLFTWLGGSALAGVLAIILVVAIVLTPLAALAVFAFGLGGSAALPVAALDGLGNTLLPGRIWRQSEFVHGLTGDCGPDALTMAQGWSVQQPVDGATVYATYLRMRSGGLADPNGASTLADLAREAQVDGSPFT